jgi:integrase
MRELKKVKITGPKAMAGLWNTNGYHRASSDLPLYLHIAGNSRRWVYRYGDNKSRKEIRIGYPVPPNAREERDALGKLTLAQARDEAARWHADRKNKGIVPEAAAKRGVAGALTTFAEDARAYYELNEGRWVPEHARYWWATVSNHILPVIGDRTTSSLTPSDITAALEPIWRTHNDTGVKLHGRVNAVLDRAMAVRPHEFAGRANPATGVIKHHLPKIKTKDVPRPSIGWRDVPALYRTLAERDDTPAHALRFLLLCGAPRAAEITWGLWQEIDGDLFRVPGQRKIDGLIRPGVKSLRPRVIPLVPPAIELLGVLRARAAPDQRWIFPANRRGKTVGGVFQPFMGKMYDDAMQLLLKELGYGCTVHGFRSTFRTWATEALRDVDKDGQPDPDRSLSFLQDQAVEAHLDHKVSGEVRSRYERTGLIVERRQILEQWAAHLVSGG